MVSQAGKKNVEATFFNKERSYNKKSFINSDEPGRLIARKRCDENLDICVLKLTDAQNTPRSVAGIIWIRFCSGIIAI